MHSNELMGKCGLTADRNKMCLCLEDIKDIGREAYKLWQTANKFLAEHELTLLHAIRLRVSISCAKWTFPKEPLGTWPEPGAL